MNNCLVSGLMLEQVYTAIKKGLIYSSWPDHFYDFYDDFYKTRSFQSAGNNANFIYDSLLSLIQFIDILVLYDSIYYDEKWAFNKIDSKEFYPVANFLKPLPLSKEEQEELKLFVHNKYKSTGNYGADGAIYYSTLSNLLGIHYWPDPERARYLAKTEFSNNDHSFIYKFNTYITENIRNTIMEALKPFVTSETYCFSGFGTFVLRNSKTRDDILSTALELRSSKECRAFRNWLHEIEQAIETGDLATVSKELRSVTELLTIARKKLLILDSKEKFFEMQIGLSPSIQFESNQLKILYASLRPKPLHLIFLRNHLGKAIIKSNLWKDITKLFPEIKCGKRQIIKKINNMYQ